LSQRKQRLQDFNRRVETSPSDVLIHLKKGWRYIPVHQFGQAACDAYWEIDHDMCFLQVWTHDSDQLSRRGLYARISPGKAPWLNVVAVVDAPSVSRDALETAMEQFAALGAPDPEAFPARLGDTLSRADGEG